MVYLVISDKAYPRKLAFSYLDELSKEFATSYGAKVETVRKPYAFVGFGGYCDDYALLIAYAACRHLHGEDGEAVPRH